jgi:hypothetical protein
MPPRHLPMGNQAHPHQLSEGNSYQFTVLHEIEMPPDNEAWYVLESETGSRHLVLKDFYRHYQLQPGARIICRVDKVNCSGKIFLEPEHPFCKAGDIIPFSLTSQVEITNSFGDIEQLLLLSDPWGQPAHLQVSGTFKTNAHEIFCRIDRIKKGILLISDPERNYVGDGSAPLAANSFTIQDICTLAPQLEYYVLSQGKSLFYLRTKYFTQYDFEKGGELKARVIGSPSLYEHYIEPIHPFYQPGEIYDFDFVRTEKSGITEEQNSYKIIVRDLLGHEYPLERLGTEPQWITKVRARIKEIRMSKCQLEFISLE